MAKDCPLGGCRKCAKKHSTLLHEDREWSKENKIEQGSPSAVQEVGQNKAVDTICTYSQVKEQIESDRVLLSMALVKVRDHKGHYIEGRVLLDSGS